MLVVSCNFLSIRLIRIVVSCFYPLTFCFEKFSTWIWRLPSLCHFRLFSHTKLEESNRTDNFFCEIREHNKQTHTQNPDWRQMFSHFWVQAKVRSTEVNPFLNLYSPCSMEQWQQFLFRLLISLTNFRTHNKSMAIIKVLCVIFPHYKL